MNLTYDVERLLLPVSVDLQEKLNELANNAGCLDSSTHALTFNCRDKSYSPENGGFHPVEIRMVRLYDQWVFDYITDFSYLNGELVKEADFNFTDGMAQFLFTGTFSINDECVSEFWQLWESNFMSYLDMGCFDEVEVQST